MYNLYVRGVKSLSLVLVLFILWHTGKAQVGDPLSNLIPQPPNSAALFKFQETPVNFYNGTTSTSIPIYEIVLGNFKLPISLSYHSGGIKVNEEASWVGLGWALSAGGSINFSQVGSRDEEEHVNDVGYMQYNIVPNYGTLPDGTPMNVIERGLCFPDYNHVLHNFSKYPHNESIDRLASSNREFDLYLYSFGNYSGKFINPKVNYYDDKFVTLDNSNIKFTTIPDQNGSSTGFKAVTPDGTVYIFTTAELYQFQPGIGLSRVSNNYHLTSITTKEGRTIQFTYKSIQTTLLPPASHSYVTGLNGSNGYSFFENKGIAEAAVVNTQYISEISWDNGSIKFISDNQRQDIAGGYKLNQVEVYNSSNTLIKSAAFNYDYFTGDLHYGDYFQEGDFFLSSNATAAAVIQSNEAYRSKRLKLLSVTFSGQPPYNFDYYGTAMPYKTAFAKDLWDYFNGVTIQTGSAPQAYSMIPDPTRISYYDKNIPPAFYQVPGLTLADRHADANFMTAGSLKKISYPTGGYTVFEYEPNHFAPPSGTASNIITTQVAVLDVNDAFYDHKSEEFTMPTVNTITNVNTGKISIRLVCGCSVGCDVYNPQAPLNTANGLFVLLEKWNTDHWETVQYWDYRDFNISSNHGLYTTSFDFIQGTKYRISANYPDRSECNPNVMSSGAANLIVQYYDHTTIEKPNIGGGIRIKTISNYNFDGQLASAKSFSYEGGLLLTKPEYFRYVTRSPFTYRANDCLSPNPCYGCDLIADYVPVYIPGTTIQVGDKFFTGFYSEPKIPYSYGASGCVVGYDKVTVQELGQGSNGKTEYVYHNAKDLILSQENGGFFPGFSYDMRVETSLPPGIPPIKDPLNGTLKSQTVYKKEGDLFKPLTKTSYDFQLANRKTYWAYKVERVFISGLLSTCNLPVDVFARCNESLIQFLNFYPVNAVNVNLVSKTEQFFDGLTIQQSVTANAYNSVNQLKQVTTTNSQKHILSKEMYYPVDFPAGGSVTAEMINRNMLDYPVQEITKDITDVNNTKELNRKNTGYNYFNGAILPETYQSSVSGNTPETDETLDAYDNKGNTLQITSRDGITTCFLWGYHQSYPVAMIKGATYSEVLAALGQSDPNLSYLQNMTDAQLETVFNTLRSNLAAAKPAALVSTWLYIPLVGIKQAMDVNNRKTSYEYDSNWRLQLIRDQNGHIVKTFDYHFRQ